MIRKAISNSSFFSNKKKVSNNALEGSTGVVVYVHLDDSEATGISLIDDLIDIVSDKEMVIGHAKVASRTDSTHDLTNIPEYAPANPDEGVPLIGEVVQLVKIGSTLFYKRIPSIDINAGNSEENALLEGTPKEEQPGSQHHLIMNHHRQVLQIIQQILITLLEKQNLVNTLNQHK